MNRYNTILCLLFLCAACKSTQNSNNVPDPMEQDGYKLVWSDEFDKDGRPDSTKWGYEYGFVRNHEAQWYQPENAWCENGMLIIEGRREDKPNPGFEKGSNDWRQSRDSIHYTSSSLNTRNKHSWTYGRFVMRGKIDISDGLWPAWWTLGTNGPWPSNGEIDIMEYYRGKLLANIAMGTDKPYTAHWFANTFSVDSLGGQAWGNRFHVWRMDWDETAIALYVDDHLLNRVALSQLVNKDASGVNPFQHPHYMLLNLAIGGDNGGDPTATSFPKRFEVDYVRVYQKQ